MAQPEEQIKLNDNEDIVVKNESLICSAEKMTESMIQNDYQTDVTSANVFESGYSTLESINDDCLLQICKYLHFMDVVHLAAACARIKIFANDNYFPMKVKRMTIGMTFDMDAPVFLIVPLMLNASKLRLESLETALSYFGEFVENFTIKSQLIPSQIGCIAANVLEYCEYLTALCIDNFQFTLDETRALHDGIEKLQNLKKLNLRKCTGILSNWPATSGAISKVEELSLSANDGFKIHFFEQFSQLSSLTVDFDDFAWRVDDLALIFELNGNLKRLKIIDSFNDVTVDYEPIFTIIMDKLPKLERLEYQGDLNETIITKLKHFKSLEINCHDENFNSIMPKIDKTIIEELAISHAIYYDEDTNGPPLLFSQLQYIRLFHIINPNNFLKIITESSMPEIHTLEFHYEADECETQKLLNFVESKKTLKSIILHWDGVEKIFSFLSQIIEILQKSGTPKRPFLNLKIYRTLTAEDMELVNVNRHLIAVERSQVVPSNPMLYGLFD